MHLKALEKYQAPRTCEMLSSCERWLSSAPGARLGSWRMLAQVGVLAGWTGLWGEGLPP